LDTMAGPEYPRTGRASLCSLQRSRKMAGSSSIQLLPDLLKSNTNGLHF
jgi:hypothetical protein